MGEISKADFITRQFHRTHNKRFENYVLTRIWHGVNSTDVKMITQQYVIREDGRALLDAYFPQFNIGIEVDEAQHKIKEYATYLKNEKEKYYLGGCIICVDENGNNMFEYHCKDCGYEYNKAKVIEDAYSKIENIKGYIGGYFQGYQYFEINLLSGDVFYSRDNEDKLELVKIINKKQISKLIQDLKTSNILNWNRKYIDRDILDGTQWSLTIDVNGRKREKIGSNMYPKEWELYCKIISRILKEDFS